MEKRYISENRYKKSSVRKRREVKKITKKNVDKNNVKSTTKKVKTNKKIRKRKNTRKNNIIVCVILLILITVISRAILKEEGEPFIPDIFKTENEQIITVGVITEENLLDINVQNIIVREMNSYSKDMLLKVDDSYNIEYMALDGVNKISNSEYQLVVNKKYVEDISKIKSVLETYSKSEQYNGLKNIQDIKTNENIITVTLSQDDSYFIYNLEVSIETEINNLYKVSSNSTDNKIIYDRTKNASIELPKQIIITKYKDMYKATNAYKNSEINMLVTSKSNVQNMLGRYEYNIKSYRNGEAVFLFANPKSNIMQEKNIRQAIAYGIDRDKIIKEVIDNMGDKIDLPYIYDNIKYRYDIYASENILLTSGYVKSNKVYTKTENGKSKKLELNLVVNKEDNEKVEVANSIKNNLSAIGIMVNVEKLSLTKLEQRINKGDYDLVLATVNLSKNPDVSFLKDNLIAVDNLSLTTSKDTNALVQNLKILQNEMSNNIVCIGIYAKTNYVIYDDSIVGIGSLSYKNVFKDIINVEEN